MTDAYGPPSTPPPKGAQTPVSLPTAKLIALTVGLSALVGVGLWGASAFIRPGAGVGAALGATAGLIGTLAGTLAVQPWKPRPVARWGFILLGAQGLSMLGVTIAAVGLYSASRPDPAGLLVGAVMTFLCVNIAQASVAGARLKAALAG